MGAIHMHGVVSCLLKMGHNVVLLNSDHPKNEADFNNNHYPSLRTSVKNRLQNWRPLRPIGGGLAIIWLFLRSVYNFFLTSIIILRKKGRFDVIYRRHTLFNFEYLLARIWRIPSVQEVNGLVTDDLKMMGWVNRVFYPIIDGLEKINMSKADKIIVVTSKLKATLTEYYRVPGHKIVVIPNNHYICFIGTFNAWAGVENVIKSAPLVLKECPDTRFLIVGDGILKQEMNNLSGRLGITDKIIITGVVPYQKVPLYIGASDICVCPVSDNFRNIRVGGGSPLKLPEYIACARPVVVGNVVELSKDITDSGSGLAVNMNNLDELAQAFVSLLKDEELRKNMGERGRQAALGNYSWMRVAQQVVDVCQSLIKEKVESD
jgi:glycosyltransferase involved in cell wall biosynthesis